jgi:hypothetical protein
MTPIAMSSTLPFMANSLNSFSIVPPYEDVIVLDWHVAGWFDIGRYHFRQTEIGQQ